MKYFYECIIYIIKAYVNLSSLWSHKSKQRKSGLNDQKLIISETNANSDFWFHCASLGEFEQVNYLIKQIKNKFPSKTILLTFFSASGYEQKKDYPFADYIHYLPYDSYQEMNEFIDAFSPKIVFWIRYEFWRNCISLLNNRNCTLILLNGVFRPNINFIYKKYISSILKKFTNIYTINKNSQKALKKQFNINGNVLPDTRYDRMKEVSETKFSDDKIETFINKEKVIICGSTWRNDELLLKKVITKLFDYKMLVIPHEVNQGRLAELIKIFPSAIQYSKYQEYQNSQIMIVDTIGMLSKTYRYADIVYVGGGFDKVVHSLVEPLAYYKPIIIGKNITKSEEALTLVNEKIVNQIRNHTEFVNSVRELENTNNTKLIKSFFTEKIGSTNKIIDVIKKIYEI